MSRAQREGRICTRENWALRDITGQTLAHDREPDAQGTRGQKAGV